MSHGNTTLSACCTWFVNLQGSAFRVTAGRNIGGRGLSGESGARNWRLHMLFLRWLLFRNQFRFSRRGSDHSPLRRLHRIRTQPRLPTSRSPTGKARRPMTGPSPPRRAPSLKVQRRRRASPQPHRLLRRTRPPTSVSLRAAPRTTWPRSEIRWARRRKIRGRPGRALHAARQEHPGRPRRPRRRPGSAKVPAWTQHALPRHAPDCRSSNAPRSTTSATTSTPPSPPKSAATKASKSPPSKPAKASPSA